MGKWKYSSIVADLIAKRESHPDPFTLHENCHSWSLIGVWEGLSERYGVEKNAVRNRTTNIKSVSISTQLFRRIQKRNVLRF
jgi:hypothetical protein